MKVYVLTCGDYSSYSIMEVTVNKAVAEALAKLHSWEIEEFDAIEEADEIIREVESMRSGWKFMFSGNGEICKEDMMLSTSSMLDEVIDLDRNNAVSVEVWNEDLEKAKKIAQDMRAKYFAEKLGL